MESIQRSQITAKVLVAGTGIAGLSAALKFAQKFDVILISKDVASEGATRYAQGGIAAVFSEEDSYDQHIADTLNAGAGLCNLNIVDICVKEGPKRVRELIEWGVPFTKASSASEVKGSDFDLHKEGGHQQRRILHVKDTTGLAIEESLLKKVREHSRIRIFEHHMLVDLITNKNQGHRGPGNRCYGAYVLDVRSGKVFAIGSEVTVLATGGAGKAYLYTSNPHTATGDGIAVAARAGARVANMEFMQFHPTCLFHPEGSTFLISEALRGDGAILKNVRGEAFMDRYHAMASLAPRDIVARAIDMEMKRTSDRHVLLDATPLGDRLKTNFPSIYATCKKYGIDAEKQPIPVVPAAHYTCGGVLVDEWARTSIEGLYALGEVACTGLHGANRLASNSLLEAVVFADRVVQKASAGLSTSHAHRELPESLPEWDPGYAVELEEQIDIASAWIEVRTLMWNYVGIVRSDRRLESAARRLAVIQSEVNQYYWSYLLTRDLLELRNLISVADLIVKSAMSRRESRGLHYTVDYPEKSDEFYLRDTIL